MLMVLSVASIMALAGSASAHAAGMPPHPTNSFGGSLIAWAGSVQAEEKGQPQQFCPITGEKIDKAVYLDYKGKRVYFCCEDCKKSFLKDPDKQISALEAKGVVLEKSPTGSEGPAPGQGGHEPDSGHAGHMH
jgi:YHS domain-containing protein